MAGRRRGAPPARAICHASMRNRNLDASRRGVDQAIWSCVREIEFLVQSAGWKANRLGSILVKAKIVGKSRRTASEVRVKCEKRVVALPEGLPWQASRNGPGASAWSQQPITLHPSPKAGIWNPRPSRFNTPACGKFPSALSLVGPAMSRVPINALLPRSRIA